MTNQSSIENFLLWLTATWFRLALFSVTLICMVDFLVKKWIKNQKFRSQVDALPGPPAPLQILGNIPSKVLSLLDPWANTRDSVRRADHFYLSQIESLLGHTRIYNNEHLFRIWLGQEPVICVWKAEAVERVLADNSLLEKSYHYDFLKPWLGDGLLTSPGRIWKPRRKLLVPSFHFNILRAFVPVFDNKSKIMVRNIKRRIDESFSVDMTREDAQESIVVDITPIITSCTLDAICETIMGVSIEAQETPDNDYCQSIYIVGETFLERIIQPRYWLDWIFNRTELGKLYQYHLNKLHSFTRKVIAQKRNGYKEQEKSQQAKSRNSDPKQPVDLSSKLKILERSSVDNYEASLNDKTNGKSDKDRAKLPKAFLDLLLDKVIASERALANSNEEKQFLMMSDEDIREEVDTFMFEGHDTTAMALSWTLFLLGHNVHIQTKLRSEINELFEDDLGKQQANIEQDINLDLDKLKKLKYLDCVIKEALRLCPSVPFIGRKTTQEFKFDNGMLVPSGCVLFVLIYQLHRDPQVFPNPEKFEPDRFLPENTIGRHPFAYVPFSAGPRNCIGQKFAMAEMKTILLHLIRNFTFESVTPLEKAQVRMEMVLRPKSALNIRIRRVL